MEEVEIAKLHADDLPQVIEILNDGFGGKRCCLVCPATESVGEGRRRFQSYNSAKWDLCAVAKKDTQVLGFIQCSVVGVPVWPMNIHTCKPGEFYIDAVAVSSDARGLGVGTKLIRWAEEAALERNCDRLTLEVIKGNRAQGLYERFGFHGVDKASSPVSGVCENFLICCLLGRPYGLCNPEWGSLEMVKQLDNGAEMVNMER